MSEDTGAPKRRGRPPLARPDQAAAEGKEATLEPHGAGGRDRQFVTALARGIQILQCFNETYPELSGSQIAKLTGLPQPTVWRLCHTLLEMGMLILGQNERMRPGLAVLRLGYSAISGLDILDLARPDMQAIASEYGAACGLGVREGLHMVFIERCEGRNQLLMNLRVGSTVPLASSALGWAFIGGHDAQGRARIMRELALTDPVAYDATKAELQRALLDFDRTGYVLNEGVFHKAYNTVATPIVTLDGRVPFVLNCGSAAVSLPVETLKREVAPRLLALRHMLQRIVVAKAL